MDESTLKAAHGNHSQSLFPHFFRHLIFCLLFVIGAQSSMARAVGEPKTLHVAVFKDIGVGPCFRDLVAVLRKQPDIDMTIINGEDVRDGALSNFDVFMVPGGSGKKEARSLEGPGEAEVKRYVRAGGCYVGTCAGCYLASDAKGFMGLLPVGIRDRAHWERGETKLPIEFTRAGEEVCGVARPMANIVYHNGPVLDCRQAFEDPELAKNLVPLAYFRDEIVAPGGERGVMTGAPAMVLGKYGKGLVLGISPHPEQTPPLHKIIPHFLHWLCDNVQSGKLPRN